MVIKIRTFISTWKEDVEKAEKQFPDYDFTIIKGDHGYYLYGVLKSESSN